MKTLRPLSLLLCLCLLSTTCRASDWPQWRGPNRDALVNDSKHPLTALPKDPKILWRLNVGPGHSAPVIAGNKLVYLDVDERNSKEIAHVVDLATGREIWSAPYADAAEYSNFGPGPRCAPLVDGDRLYVQSGRGEFRCLSLADGKTIWRTNFETDFGAVFYGNRGDNADAKETASRRHGNNGSAVIDGDRIYVPVGSPKGACLVCFDKQTGKMIWKAGNDNTAYSSVMVATLGGVRQAVHYTADALMGVDCAGGKVLWRIPIKTGAKRHTATPVISGDTVTVASHSVGIIKTKISKAANEVKAEQAWLNGEVKTMLTTPVLVDGHLYGLGTTKGKNSDFVCLDFNTGKEVWSKPGFEDYASVIALQDKLLVLNSNGELFLLKANPAKYEELGRLQVCGKTWSFPAYVDGTFYVRDGRQLVAMALAQ